MLDHVIYYSLKSTTQALVSLNRHILARLESDGIGLASTIYVATDDPASSSHVMLNLLRDAENLERKQANFVGAREVDRLQELTSRIGSGAIIYVDDFAGTGRQFRENRDWVAQFTVGAFSEFFLAPVICEEAYELVVACGVEPVADLKHTIDQRPLHPECGLLPRRHKRSMLALCQRINPSNPKVGLGFGRLATMVVFYRNSPNTMPLVFRGSLKQLPFRGIFPRSTDLPF